MNICVCIITFDIITVNIIRVNIVSLGTTGSCSVSKAFRVDVEWQTGVNFINVLYTAFTLVDPESVKNTVKSSVTFYTFGIYGCKSCT